MKGPWCLCAAAVVVLAWASRGCAAAAVAFSENCAAPSKFDPIVLNTSLHGHPNSSDSVWHDDTWAFRRFGPISRLTLYKAWYYDGEWHDPGELKGIQAWHGRYHFTDQTRLLFGAKRPHVPLNCTLYRSEGIVRAELQWDHIMRFMNFTTNLGRYCAWGFASVTNVTTVVVTPPAPNTYIAALRGFEGKPLPPSQGGFKKRYIVQLGFAWAKLNCGDRQQQAVNNATRARAAAPAVNHTRTALQPPTPIVAAAAAAATVPPALVPAAPAAAVVAPLARQPGVDFVSQPVPVRAAGAAAPVPAADAVKAKAQAAAPARVKGGNLTAAAAASRPGAARAAVVAAQ